MDAVATSALLSSTYRRYLRSLLPVRDPALAAKIYLDATKEKYSVDEIVAMIKAPNVVYSTTPNATMVFANFMFKTGLIKTKPASWKEFFFPAVHGLPGT